ncbi:MAG: hypothetical protein QMD13_09335 [Candidatus Bathyarchaeia archaeon]|nr:hypothetical protein [Candidatus Bathyarchaeia archaeon]
MGYVTVTREWMDVNAAPRIGAKRGDPNYHAGIDLNHDGKIDIADLSRFAMQIGETIYVNDITGAVEITCFKLPWVSWDDVANKIIDIIGPVVSGVTGFLGQPVFLDYPYEVRGGFLGTSIFSIAVYGSPIEPGVVAVILSIILGLVIAGCAFLWFKYVERGAVLQEVAKTLEETQSELEELEGEVEEAYEAGEISEITRNKLLEHLSKVKEEVGKAGGKAKEAGEEKWWENWYKYLEPVMGMLPLILMFAIVATVMGMIPRRRE